MAKPTFTELKGSLPRPSVLIGWFVLVGAVILTYHPTILFLIGKWWRTPDYGHGFFVPVFSLVLLWHRRDMAKAMSGKGSWWGLVFIAIAAALVTGGTYFQVLRAAPLSLIPCFAGFALLIGGWPAIRWAWPSIMFLFFMLPLPGFLEAMLRQPLQYIGTMTSVFVIQTLGIAAVAQGNVIQLTEGELGVVEACSGLRMLMLFFAICVGAAFILRCTAWEKVLIVVSAVPIAVFSNVARITITAILYEAARKWPTVISTETANWVFHDMAGLLMMPLAMLLLWGEMALLSKLLLEPHAKTSLSMSIAERMRTAETTESTAEAK